MSDHSGPTGTGRRLGSDAVTGAVVVIVRSAGITFVALVGNIVFARLLAPSQFGAIALGSAVVAVGTVLAEGGLGVGFIRRVEPPSTEEMRSLVGLQLALTTLVTAIVVSWALEFGQAGLVTAIMTLSLPLLALRTPSFVLLERSMDFRRLATVEVCEPIIYYAYGVVVLILGFGVVGLATAAIVRAGAGTAVMWHVSPHRIPRPSFAWRHMRHQWGFGARFQVTQLVNFGGNQALNFGTVAIAGAGALGQWTLARQVLQVPMLLFQALWRVSFPAMARALGADADLRRVVERAAGVTALASGLILGPLICSSAVLVPALFGERWTPAASVIPWAAAGLLVGGPVSVAAAGALYALGAATVPLRSTLLASIAWCAVAFVGLGRWGVVALGAGWLVSCAIDAAILGRAIHRRTQARILCHIAGPVAAAAAGAVAGWLLVMLWNRPLWSGIAAGLACLIVYAGALALFQRRQTTSHLRFLGRAWAGSRRRGSSLSPSA